MDARVDDVWLVGWLVGIELNFLHYITCIHTLYIDIFLHSILLMTDQLTKSAVLFGRQTSEPCLFINQCARTGAKVLAYTQLYELTAFFLTFEVLSIVVDRKTRCPLQVN